jgi:hypothetical protein
MQNPLLPFSFYFEARKFIDKFRLQGDGFCFIWWGLKEEKWGFFWT